MRWALAVNDPLHWLAGVDDGLIAVNDGAFKTHLDRYKYPQRHGSDAIAHRSAGLAILEQLELRLRAQPQLCGPAESFTDIAIFPFVRQFAATDAGWFAAQPLPAVQRWLAGHCAAPLFDAAMRRLPAWKAGDAPVYFGDQA
jgi:glutathione S-transferase